MVWNEDRATLRRVAVPPAVRELLAEQPLCEAFGRPAEVGANRERPAIDARLDLSFEEGFCAKFLVPPEACREAPDSRRHARIRRIGLNLAQQLRGEERWQPVRFVGTMPRAVGSLARENLGPEPFVRDARTFGGDRLRRGIREIAHRLPADRRIGIESQSIASMPDHYRPLRPGCSPLAERLRSDPKTGPEPHSRSRSHSSPESAPPSRSLEPFRALPQFEVRTPLNNGKNPPVHVIRSPGMTPETLCVNMRAAPWHVDSNPLPCIDAACLADDGRSSRCRSWPAVTPRNLVSSMQDRDPGRHAECYCHQPVSLSSAARFRAPDCGVRSCVKA